MKPKTVVIYASSGVVRDAVKTQAVEMGIKNVITADGAKECMGIMPTYPDALLVIDWDIGAKVVVSVLEMTRESWEVLVRPILLIASSMDEETVGTAYEYGVTMIHSGPITPVELRGSLNAVAELHGNNAEICDTLVKVMEARKSGAKSLANKLLKELHSQHPENPRVAMELAEGLIHTNAWGSAMQLLEPLMNVDPPFLRALHLYGRCMMKTGQFDRAIEVLERADLLNPHNANRLVDLGNAFLQADQINDAKGAFDRAIEVDEKNNKAKTGVGKCLLMSGDVNQALSMLREIANPREMAAVFNTSAILTVRRGRFDLGFDLYEKAMTVVGDNKKLAARLVFNKGIGYKRCSKFDKARNCFSEALELDPDYKKAAKQKEVVDRRLGGDSFSSPQSAVVSDRLEVDFDDMEIIEADEVKEEHIEKDELDLLDE